MIEQLFVAIIGPTLSVVLAFAFGFVALITMFARIETGRFWWKDKD